MGQKPAPTVIQQTPVAQPAPPVTSTAAEVMQGKTDQQRQELARKNIKRTVFAGDRPGPIKPMSSFKPVGGNPFNAVAAGGNPFTGKV